MQQRPVSELCLLAVDCVNKTAPTVDYETPYKMIRTTNIKGGFIDLSDVSFVTEATFETWTRRSKPQFGDVILTREAPVGEVGRFTSKDENVFLGQRLFHYRSNPKLLDWNYLAYALQSHEVQGRFRGMGFGATVDHVKVGDAETLLIPWCPLDVQKRIGSTLAAYDDLIENNRRRIALLEEAARLLYQEWFSNLRFPGQRMRVRNGVPEGWARKTLGDLCHEVREQAIPGDLDPDTPYIGLEHIPRRSITLSSWGRADEVTSTKHRFLARDIIFGKIRPYFHKVGFALIDGVASSDAIVIRPNDEKLYALVLLVLSSDEFIGVVSKTVREGSKMPRADWKVMQQYSIVVPPPELLAALSDLVTPMLQQLRLLALQNLKLRMARDLLVPRLMNSEIEV